LERSVEKSKAKFASFSGRNLTFFRSLSTRIHTRRASQRARCHTGRLPEWLATPTSERLMNCWLQTHQLVAAGRAKVPRCGCCRSCNTCAVAHDAEVISPPDATAPPTAMATRASARTGGSKALTIRRLGAERQVVRTDVLLQTRTLRYPALSPQPSALSPQPNSFRMHAASRCAR